MEQNNSQFIDPGLGLAGSKPGSLTQQYLKDIVQQDYKGFIPSTYSTDISGHPYKGYSKYDAYLSSGSDQGYVRAGNQNNWERFGNALVNFPIKVAAKTLQTGASIGGGIYELGKKLAPGVSGDIIKGLSDNPVLNAIRDFENRVDESVLPVYTDRYYDESNAIGKLGSFSWWAKDFADGAAFAASAWLTGYGATALTGKLGSISTALQEANLSNASIKSVANYAGKALLKSKEFTGLGSKHLLTGLVNTSFEAGSEAYDASKQVSDYYDALIEQAKEFKQLDKVEKLQKEKESNAAAARDSTFMYNALLLGVTNTLGEAKWFLGNDAAIYNKLKTKLISANISQAEKTAIEQTIQSLGKPRLLKGFWNGVKNEAFVEENFQSAIQNRFFNKYTRPGGADKDSLEDHAVDLASIVYQSVRNAAGFVGNTLSILPNAVGMDVRGIQTAPHSPEDEASQAMFAATGLGGSMSSYSEMRDHKQKQAFIEKYGERALAFKNIVDIANKHFVENMTQPLNMYDHTITDAEGNVKTKKIPIDPATGKISINPQAIANANQRNSNIMESHRIAQEAILDQDVVGFERNRRRTIAEWAYDLMSLAGYSIEEDELDAILDSIPMFQDDVMDALEEKDILQKNKSKLREYALDLKKQFNKTVKIKDLIPAKTKEELSLLNEDELEEYNKQRRETNLQMSISNDVLRTHFYVDTSLEALLDADPDLVKYSQDTVADENVLKSLSPEQGGRYLDLIELNSIKSDLEQGDKSTTKKIITDQLSRQLRNKEAFEKAKKDIANLDLDISKESDETKKAEMLGKRSAIIKKFNAESYLNDEANKLEGFSSVAALVDSVGEKTIVSQYNVSDTKSRKVGAPRLYSTKNTPGIAAINEGRLVSEKVYERLLTPINQKLDNSNLTIEELEVISQEISDIIDKFGYVTIGSKALYDIINKLEEKYIPFTTELSEALHEIVLAIEGTTENLLEWLNRMPNFAGDEENLSYGLEIIRNAFAEIDDNLSAIEKTEAFTNTLNKFFSDLAINLNVEFQNPPQSFLELFNQLLSKIENGEIDLNVFPSIVNAIDTTSSNLKKDIQDMQTNFTYLANKTLSKDQILNDITNNENYEKNPQQFNLTSVFEKMFNDEDQKTLSKFTNFLRWIQSDGGLDFQDPKSIAELFTDLFGTELGENGVDDFTNLDLVNNVLRFLEKAAEAYRIRTDVSDTFRETMLNRIKELQELYKIIQVKTQYNISKQDAKNQLYLDFKTEGVFKVFGFDAGKNPDPNNELIQLLNEVLSDTDKKALEELEYQKGENSFSNLLGLLSLAKASFTSEQAEKFTKILEDIENSIIEKFLTENPGIGKAWVKQIRDKKLNGLYDTFNLFASTLLKNPTKEFISPFYELPQSALFQIFEHGSYIEAILRIDKDVNSGLLTAEQGNILYKYVTEIIQPLNGLKDLKNILGSSLSYLDLKTEVEKIASELGINLSQQQFATAMDMLLFLSTSNTDEKSMGYAAVLNGVLGSGKSTITGIILKTFNKLNKDSKLDRIKGVGHVENSAENINKHIDSSRKDLTTLDKVTAEYLKTVDILVVDEAFAFSNTDIAKLHTLVLAENKTRSDKNKIKVLFLGDMSQNKIEEDHVLLTYKGLSGLSKSIEDNYSINRISPLATIYRSNISSIVDALMKFKDIREEVPVIDTLSNISSLQEYDANSLGVTSINSQTLPTFLANRPTNREAIIIVNNNNAVNTFINQLKAVTSKTLEELNIKVLSYYNVQSLTTDEVYILLDKNEKDHIGKSFTDKAFNTAMYTSIGRAKFFVGISSNSVIVHSNKQDIDTSLDLGEEVKDKLKKSREKIEEGFANAAERYFGVKKENKEKEKEKPIVKKDEKEEEDTSSLESSMDIEDTSTGDEEDIDVDEQGIEVEPVDNIEDIIPDVKSELPFLTLEEISKLHEEGHLPLQDVTNQAIKNILDDLPQGKIMAKIIAIRDDETVDPKRQIRYVVVAADRSGRYYAIAQLNEEEINSSFAHIPEAAKGKGIVSFNSGMKAIPAKDVIQEIEIKNLQKATYSYVDNEADKVPADFEDIIMTWITGFYGTDMKSASDALFGGKPVAKENIDWSKFSTEVVTYALFNRYKLGERGFHPDNIIGSVVLSIKGYNLKSKNALPQIIILSQAPANSLTTNSLVDGNLTNPWFEKTIRPIIDFTKAIKELENIFLEDAFVEANTKGKKLYLGDGHKTLNTDIIDEFAKLGYEYFTPGLPLRSNAIDILRKILSSENVEFNSDKLTDEDMSKLIRHLDTVIKMLYTEKTKDLVIQNTEEAIEDAKRIFGNNYTLDFEQVVGKQKNYVKVRILDVDGNLSNAEVPIHSLGGTEVTKAWNRFANGVGNSKFKGFQLTTLSKENAEGAEKRFLSPKSLLSLRHGSKTRADGSTKLSLTGLIKYRFRLAVLGDPKSEPHVQNVDPKTLETLQTAMQDFINSEFKDRQFQMSNEKIIEGLKKVYPEEVKELLDSVVSNEAVPITSKVLEQITQIIPGVPVVLDNGKVMRLHTDSSVSAVSLANKDARTTIQSKLTSGFKGYMPPSITLVNNEVSEEATLAKADDYVKSMVGKEDTKESGYKKLTDKQKANLKKKFDNTPLSWLANLIFPHLGNVRIYIDESGNLDINGLSVTYLDKDTKDPIIVLSKNYDLEVLAHELIHALTLRSLHDPKTAAEIQFAKRIKRLQELFEERATKVTGIALKDIYQNTLSQIDVKEFIANLSNPLFVQAAQQIKIKQKGGISNLLKEIVKAIVDLFGLSSKENPNIYELTVKSLTDFLSNPIEENTKPVEPVGDNDKERLENKILELDTRYENDLNNEDYLFKKDIIKDVIEQIDKGTPIGKETIDDLLAFGMSKKVNKNPGSEEGRFERAKLENISLLKKEFEVSKSISSIETFNTALFLIKKQMYLEMENSIVDSIPVSYLEAKQSTFKILSAQYGDLLKQFREETENVLGSRAKHVLDENIPSLDNINILDLEYFYDKLIDKYNKLPIDSIQHDILGKIYSATLIDLKNLMLKYQIKLVALETISKNNNNIYNKTIRYIFNNWAIFPKENTDANLASEIQDNDERNLVSSFTESLKTYLSLIPIRDESGDIISFVLPKTAIKTLFELFENTIDFTELNTPEVLRRTLIRLRDTGLNTKEDIAIFNKLIQTIGDFTSQEDLPKNITVFVDSFSNNVDSFQNSFYVIETINPAEDINLEGFTVEEAKHIYGDKVKITQYSSFKNFNIEAHPGLNMEQAIKMFLRSKSFNDLANIKSYLGSATNVSYLEIDEKTKFNFGEDKGDFSLTRLSRVSKKVVSSYKTKTKEHLINNLISLLSGSPVLINEKLVSINAKNFDTTFKPIASRILTATSTNSKVAALKQLLKLFNLEHILNFDDQVINADQGEFSTLLNETITSFKAFFESLTNQTSELHNVFKLSDPEILKNGNIDLRSLEEDVRIAFVNSQSADIFISRLSNLASRHVQVKSLNAIKTSDGKILIDYIPTSSYRQVLKDLKKPPTQRRYVNSPFFQNNIFVNGVNTVVDGSTRILLKKSGNYFTLANRFSPGKRLELMVNDLFFSQIEKSNEYYQTLYQQGEATKSETPKIKYLDLNNILDALDTMLLQLNNLDPNITSKKSYNHKQRLGFTVYDRAKKIVGDGDLTSKEYRDELKKEILKAFYEEAKSLNEDFRKKQLHVNDSIPQVYKKIKNTYTSQNLNDVFKEFFSKLVKEDELSSVDDLKAFKAHSRTFKETNYPEEKEFTYMLFAFVANNYVNSFGLSQLAYGDLNQWGSLSNLGKRAQLSASPGYYGVIHDTFGLPKQAHILMVNDVLTSGSQYHELLEKFNLDLTKQFNILHQISNATLNKQRGLEASEYDTIERTDGTLFVTPKFYYKLQKGFGSGLNLKNVMKDQAFGWTEQRIADKEKVFNSLEDLKKYLGIERAVEGVHYIKESSTSNRELTINDVKIDKALAKRVDKLFESSRFADDILLTTNKPIEESKKYYAEYLKHVKKTEKTQTLDDFKNFVETYQIKTVEETENTFYPIKIVTSPIGLKNALIVLDDNFINENSHNPQSREDLRKLREFLDAAEFNGEPISMISFKSANKAPFDNAVDLFDSNGKLLENPQLDTNNGIVTMGMDLFKIQYNPFSTDTTTAVPRQLLHFLSTIENTQIATDTYTALAQLQNILYTDLFSSSSGRTKKLSKKEIIKLLNSSIKEGQDNFSVINAIQSGLSIDHPTIVQKVIGILGSMLNKSASRIRLPGGKLILRSDIGYTLPNNRKLGHGKTSNGTLYAETVIPKHFLNQSQIDAINRGENLFLTQGDMFGFRIPSGDLNAGILLKVVDFYESDSQSNIAIMPDLEIFKQGWDFDVDALFLLNYEEASTTYMSDSLKIQKGDIVGFEPNKKYDIEDNEQFLRSEIILLNEMTKVSQELAALKDTKKEKDVVKIIEVKDKLKQLKKLRISLLKNQVVSGIMRAYLDSTNNSRILDVTTLQIIKDSIEYLKNGDQDLYTPDNIEDPSFVRDNIAMYSNVNEAANAIGIYAKGSSVNAYISKTGRSGHNSSPKISNEARFTINNRLIKKFDTRINVFGQDSVVYTVNNKLLNAFLDALKNPEIFSIGFNGTNANMIDTALSVGMDFRDVLLIFNHPAVRKLYKNRSARDLFKALETYIIDSNGKYTKEFADLNVTTKELRDAYKADFNSIEDLINKQGQSIEEINSDNESEETVQDVDSSDVNVVEDSAEEESTVEKNIDLTTMNSSLLKMFMVLYKLNKVSESKFKLISLINLAQDKPTTIAQIFNWEESIRKVFKSEFLNDLLLKLEGLAGYKLNSQQYVEAINKAIASIRNSYIQEFDPETDTEAYKSILNPNFGIESEFILEKNPHLAVALVQTLTHIKNLKQNFAIFSPDAIKVVNSFVPKVNHAISTSGQAKQNGLFSLSDLLISSFASDIINTLATNIQKLTKTNRRMQDVVGIDAFSNNLVLMLQAVEKYESNEIMTNNYYNRNIFLENLIFKPGVPATIKTIETFTEYSFQLADYHKAFNDLAKFDFEEKFNEQGEFVGYTAVYNHTKTSSQLQHDLVTYATYKYGLRGSSINFINAIDPSFISDRIKDINSVYRTWVTYNQDVDNLKNIYKLFTGMKYPDSLPVITHYIKDDKYKTSNNQVNRENLEADLAVMDNNTFHDYIISTDNEKKANLPFLVRETETKNILQQTFLVKVAVVSNGTNAYGLYQRFKYGEVILTDRPYKLTDHFRTDKPTIKFKASSEYDIHTKTVVDDNDKEHPNEFTIPYNEKFHTDRLMKEYVYGVYASDTVRHTVSLLRIMNIDLYKTDKEITFRVIEDNIGYKQQNENGEWEDIPSQEITNKELFENKKSRYKYTYRKNDDSVTNFKKNEVNVYISNDENLPIKGQVKQAFGEVVDADKKRKNSKIIKIGEYGIVGRSNTINEGRKGKGFGLAFNRIDNGVERVGTMSDMKKAFTSLILSAKNNPELTFKLTLRNVSDLYKFGLNEMAKALLDTNMPIPSNIEVNLSFHEELKKQITKKKLGNIFEFEDLLDEDVRSKFTDLQIWKSIKSNFRGVDNWREELVKSIYNTEDPTVEQTAKILTLIDEIQLGAINALKKDTETDEISYSMKSSNPNISNLLNLLLTDLVEDKAKEIKKNCEGSGGLTAESGLTIGFTPGSKWSLVKDLKGPSHAQGGIDLSIDNGRVMYSNGNTKFHAANGLVLPANTPDPLLGNIANTINLPEIEITAKRTLLDNLKGGVRKIKNNVTNTINKIPNYLMDAVEQTKNFVTHPKVPQSNVGYYMKEYSSLAAAPLNARLLIADILGNHKPITERDLTDQELEALRNVANTAMKKGHSYIKYPDYSSGNSNIKQANNPESSLQFLKNQFDPEYRIKTAIGQANIEINDRDTFVVDKYNFNDAGKKSLKEILAIQNGSPYSAVRGLASLMGSPEGEGAPIKIKLNKKKQKSIPLQNRWDLITD
ncbi:hypothetical protein EKK58_07695 [Candidatus Dependentiae bacterium]|nr:MAG: hypothetical protein EKK58_07695 [Candidatus Dependentiae bacterium]